MLPIVTPADLSQSLVKAAAARKQKMAPEAGAIKFRSSKARSFFGSRPFTESLYFQGLETKTGQVAVADGNAAAGGQQAVDRSHHAREQGGGGQEADRCSLGHGCPLFLVAEPFRFGSGDRLCIPDASYNSLVCIAAIGELHCSKTKESGIPE